MEEDELRAVAVARDLARRADCPVGEQVVRQGRRHRARLDTCRQVAVERCEASLRAVRRREYSLARRLGGSSVRRTLCSAERRRCRRCDARVEIVGGCVECGCIRRRRKEGVGGRQRRAPVSFLGRVGGGRRKVQSRPVCLYDNSSVDQRQDSAAVLTHLHSTHAPPSLVIAQRFFRFLQPSHGRIFLLCDGP